MNGFSLLLCWTLLGQVNGPLGSANAPLGSAVGSGMGAPAFGSPGTGGAGTAPLGSQGMGAGSQVGTTPLGSAGFGGASNTDQTWESDGKNYGWQINKLGELEYLIQISPSMLRDMQDPVNKSELESRIPRELVGRIKRVVVSIGNDTLPRTPLADVERLMPATASLPTGKLQNLEGGSIVNVNNPASDNGFQSYNQSTPPPITNNSAATTPLGSAFMDQARGGNQPPASGSLLDRFTGSGQGISGSRFNNSTGNALGSTVNSRTTTNGNNWNASNGYPNNGATGGSYSNGGYDRVADSRYGQTTNGYAGTQDTLGTSRWNDPNSLSNNGAAGFSQNGYGQNTYGQNGYAQTGTLQNGNLQNGTLHNGYGQGTYAQGTYAQGTYAQGANGQSGYGTNGAYGPLRNDVYANNYNNGINGQSTLASGGNRFNTLGNQNYGNDPNYLNNGYANRNQGLGGTSGFADSYGQYGGPLVDNRRPGNLTDYSGLSPATGYLASTATNRTDLPSTSFGQQATDRNYAAQGQRAGIPGYANPNYPNQDNNYFFYVFFILSIAINLWMVHLLRSLYLRYRSLLGSLRSQATTP